MRALAREFKEATILRWNGVYKFQTKVGFQIESGSYILKTATGHDELVASFRLRHEVFFQEFQGIEVPGLDVDQFDSHFDHLIIVHKESNKVIGTYRLSCSSYSQLSYTEQEFVLDEIYKLKGPQIELGRACIHKDHRKGSSVISLLWRGIIEYMNISGSQTLFGCSSVKINNPRDAALLYQSLIEQNLVMDKNLATPTSSYTMNDFDLWSVVFSKGLSTEESLEAQELMPALLKSYLKLGAKVASVPAFDKDFDCIDLLTVLKKEELSNLLARRFHVVQ
jgi:putative hemolysin